MWLLNPFFLCSRGRRFHYEGIQTRSSKKSQTYEKEAGQQSDLPRRASRSSHVFGPRRVLRTWQTSPVLLPGKCHGWRSLVGYSPQGRKELDMTEQFHFQQLLASRIKLAFLSPNLASVLAFKCEQPDTSIYYNIILEFAAPNKFPS